MSDKQMTKPDAREWLPVKKIIGWARYQNSIRKDDIAKSYELLHSAYDALARKLAEAREENARLKEVISYLPKVPTEPYEKQIAKELIEAREEHQRTIELLRKRNIEVQSRDQLIEKCEMGLEAIANNRNPNSPMAEKVLTAIKAFREGK